MDRDAARLQAAVSAAARPDAATTHALRPAVAWMPYGPEAAELIPMSTSSLPSRVITGPPESPEQMPVVAVCTAVKPPGHVGDVLSGWSIE